MPDLGKVYRMTYADISTGYPEQKHTDLIFQDGKPVAVLQWADPQDKQHPQLSVPLDQRLLLSSELPGIDYIYQDSL